MFYMYKHRDGEEASLPLRADNIYRTHTCVCGWIKNKAYFGKHLGIQ